MTSPNYIVSKNTDIQAWEEGPRAGQLWQRKSEHLAALDTFLPKNAGHVMFVVSAILVENTSKYRCGREVKTYRAYMCVIHGEKLVRFHVEPAFWSRCFERAR